MDDGDLGNFFAKKDKNKKKKKVTKVTSATLKEQLKGDSNIIEEQQSQQQSLSEAKVTRPVSYLFNLPYNFVEYLNMMNSIFLQFKTFSSLLNLNWNFTTSTCYKNYDWKILYVKNETQ